MPANKINESTECKRDGDVVSPRTNRSGDSPNTHRSGAGDSPATNRPDLSPGTNRLGDSPMTNRSRHTEGGFSERQRLMTSLATESRSPSPVKKADR